MHGLFRRKTVPEFLPELRGENQQGGRRMIAFDLYPRKCKVCGKRFESGKDYAYKHRKKGKKEFWYFCSWKCLQAFREERKCG